MFGNDAAIMNTYRHLHFMLNYILHRTLVVQYENIDVPRWTIRF